MKEIGNINFWKGQLLEIQTKEGTIYKTQVSFQEHNFVYIQKPVHRLNRPMSITPLMEVVIFFYRDDRVLYSFDTQLRLKNNRLFFLAPSADSIRKGQRRRYFRVPVELELNLDLQESKENTVVPKKVITRDISGGGLSFISPFKLKVDEQVQGVLRLETNTYQNAISFKGRIVHCQKEQNSYRISLEFIEMKESTRTDIIKYCLYKQLEARNKLKNYLL